MPSERVLLIEPFIHHARIAREICRALVALGADVVVLTTRGSGGADGVDNEPLASSLERDGGEWPGAMRVSDRWPALAAGPDPAIMRGRFNPLPKVRALARIRTHSTRAVEAIRSATHDVPPDRIVMTTSDPLDLFGLAAVHRHDALAFAMVHDPPRSRSSRVAATRLTRATSGPRRAWLCCITQQMRDLYVAAGADPDGVVVVPNPAVQPAPSKARIPVSERRSRLSYPGNGRREKGFEFFASAVPELLTDFDVAVQCYQRGDEPASVVAAARDLHEIDSPRLRLVDGAVSVSEYDALIADSMAVVLPYRPEDYGQGRISAVLPEAWAAGVPIIVSDGWWGAEMVRDYGGGVVFPFGDAAQLVRAAAEVRDHLTELAGEAEAAYVTLMEKHGPGAFARFVLDFDPSRPDG